MKLGAPSAAALPSPDLPCPYPALTPSSPAVTLIGTFHFAVKENNMSILSEFREFAIKGNMVDMAVGIIIGAAFGKVVDSLVKDVIMPPLGLLIGGVDFKHLYVNLGTTAYDSLEAAEKAGAPLLKYGAFISSLVDFLIVAWAIFIAVKAINRLRAVK
jgi:large conductance mechanosensitive channel